MVLIKVLIIVYLGVIYLCKPFCVSKWILIILTL